ncbi:MAG: hypothetical protein K2M22_00130 [Lachnospiraceae bacterium]|nr:hypothetical protein [Lachnospiraceae bacterium]MDE7178260.1 hypothetical protein [Lachnospiraceae bacterium]
MYIGNHGYESWIHNTSASGTGYGYRPAQTGKSGTDQAFPLKNESNDSDVINDADAQDTESDEGQNKTEKAAETLTYREQILAHMEEMAKKVKDGTVEPTFQTGAQSFTIKEWEKLLADFDDAEEALQEQIKQLIAEVEEQAQREAMRRAVESGTADPDEVTNVSVPEAAQLKTEAGGSVANPKTESSDSVASAKPVEVKEENVTTVQVTDPEEIASLLTDEVTKCTYPTDDPRHKHWYITCYGQDGIMCKEAYFDGTKWVNKDCWNLSYTEPGQYEKVMNFLKRFPQDANLRFASHENFWKDFLAGKVDEDDFVHFFETSTKDGVPDYTYEKDGSTYIDREKFKYAKYMNGFGARFYTAEEMQLIWRAVIHENTKGLQKISDYDGQMTIPGGENGKDGRKETDEEDDMETRIITKPDGSTVLQIKTNFGVMEIEVTEAQKFGLQYNAQPGVELNGRSFTSPFTHTTSAGI